MLLRGLRWTNISLRDGIPLLRRGRKAARGKLNTVVPRPIACAQSLLQARILSVGAPSCVTSKR
eukprot:8344862-Alexandrium_andersonii.AAC.1